VTFLLTLRSTTREQRKKFSERLRGVFATAPAMDEGGPLSGMELADAGPGPREATIFSTELPTDSGNLFQGDGMANPYPDKRKPRAPLPGRKPVMDAGDSGNQAYAMQWPSGLACKGDPARMSTGIAAEDNATGRDSIDRRVKPVSMNRPNVYDGEHFPAILMRGERVLTPQQNAEWTKEQHGFRAPSMSTDATPSMRLPDGTQIPLQNSQANAPAYDCGGPAKMVYDDGGTPTMQAPGPDAIQDAIDQKALSSASNNDILGLGQAAVVQDQYDKRTQAPKMEVASAKMETPLTSGATDHAGPGGVPASPAPRIQPPDQPRAAQIGTLPVPPTPFNVAPPAPEEEAKGPAQGGLLNLTNRPAPTMTPTLEQVASTPKMRTQAERADVQNRVAALKNIIANSPDEMEVAQARNQLARLQAAHPLFHGIPRILGDVLMGAAGIPGPSAGLAQREALARGQEEQIAGTRYKEAEAAKSAAEAVRMRAPGYGWKPAQGEQFTEYAANGTPIRQLWVNDQTGQQEWRDVPQAGAPTMRQGTARLPISGAAPSGAYFGSKQEHGVPLSPTVIASANQRMSELYHQMHPGQEVPSAYQLPPNATDKDLAEFDKSLGELDSTANRLQQQAQSQADKDRTYQLQQQLAGLREDMQNAKPAVGTDKNGQRVAGSYGDLKAAGFGNIQDNATVVNDRSYYNLSQMVTRTQQYLKDLHDVATGSPQDLDLINRINADIEPGLGAGISGAGGSLRGGWFNAMLNSADYKKLSPAAKRLANDYSQLGESAIAYLTSVSHITGMRGGTAMIDRIARAWVTPQKDYEGNLDAAKKFVQTLMAAEKITPQQYGTDAPINWGPLESAREK
jgi:hypothetical protein